MSDIGISIELKKTMKAFAQTTTAENVSGHNKPTAKPTWALPSFKFLSQYQPAFRLSKASCVCGGGCPRCAGDVVSSGSAYETMQTPRLPDQTGYGLSHLFDGKSDKSDKSGKKDCSPTWFGDTSPEIDPISGGFTGRLKVTYNEAVLKDPCVRECVEQHEAVHVADLTPVVKKIHDCDVAAGDDWNKKGKCNVMATDELSQARARSECDAYRKSFTCLTYKVLDSSNPCSKPPHRQEVDKHRGYDGCEMKQYCADAGTPEKGIPNA